MYQKKKQNQVIMILNIYKNLIENILSIPTITGYKSNKEKFVGADYTTTSEGMMPDGKALQLGTSHNLGRNFSKPFEIKFLTKKKIGRIRMANIMGNLMEINWSINNGTWR